MASSFARAATSNSLRAVKPSGGDVTRRIQLQGVPKSALPTDIWRLCARANIENVETVDIDYNRFEPTGNAWLTLTNSRFIPSTVKKFHEGIYIGAARISANAHNGSSLLVRMRGFKGRAQAAERGVLSGNGPSAGLSAGSMNVTLSGFPNWVSVAYVKQFLKSYRLAGTTDGQKEVVKLDAVTKESSARFLIRLVSSSEAHRLVRKVHELDWEWNKGDSKARLKAHIVY